MWNSCVQLKICFFTWEAIWGKILTLDLLKKRGIPLANRCYLRLEIEETVSLFGVLWVNPGTIKEAILSWKGFFGWKEMEEGVAG